VPVANWSCFSWVPNVSFYTSLAKRFFTINFWPIMAWKSSLLHVYLSSAPEEPGLNDAFERALKRSVQEKVSGRPRRHLTLLSALHSTSCCLSREPLHLKTDFYFQKCLPEIFSNIPHRSECVLWQTDETHTHTHTHTRTHTHTHTHAHTHTRTQLQPDRQSSTPCTDWQPQLEKSPILCCPSSEVNHVWSVVAQPFLFIFRAVVFQ